MATVEVGFNIRKWVVFEITDATPEELTTLRVAVQNDYQAAPFRLLSEMDEAGRLKVVESTYETGGETFSRDVDPNIIELEEES